MGYKITNNEVVRTLFGMTGVKIWHHRLCFLVSMTTLLKVVSLLAIIDGISKMQRQIQSYVNKVNRHLLLCVVFSSFVAAANNYDRKDFNCRSYKPNNAIGFYTGKTCDFINRDHVVSLKGAYESGAASWSDSKK